MRWAEPGTDELGALEKEIRARRKQALDKARKAVESERFRDLGSHAALWPTNGDWSRSDDPLALARRKRPPVDFAADMLARRSRKIVKKLDRIAELDPRQRRKLRIAVKNCAMAPVSSPTCSIPGGRNPGAGRSRRFSNRYKTRSARSTISRRIDAFGFIAGIEREQIERYLANA